MRHLVRLISTALVVASAIVLAACGSDTSAKSSGTGAERNAVGVRSPEMCVTGAVADMKVEFNNTDPPGPGPFPLAGDYCGSTSDLVLAIFTRDGVRPFELRAENFAVGSPKVSLNCSPLAYLPSSDTRSFSEGERHTFNCEQYVINVERLRDSADKKRFKVDVNLR